MEDVDESESAGRDAATIEAEVRRKRQTRAGTLHPAAPETEMTPERVADLLTAPEFHWIAYLAAFALRGGYHLLTWDQGFRAFEVEGLKLDLLSREQR